jgi:acetyl-CoA synthetase
VTVSAEDFVWVPSAEIKAASRLGAFLRRHDLSDYAALGERAAREPDWFWNALVEFFGIRFETPYEQVLDLSAGIAWPKWCVGGKTNLVLNCLDAHMATPTRDRAAIVWEGEDGSVRRWTYAELNAETCALAGGLRALGIGRGDVVGLYMPMIPETAAAFLAIAKIGAIVLPMFSGFGATAAAERLAGAGAVAVVTVDGTIRRGREVAMKPVIDEAAAKVATLRHVVVLDALGLNVAWESGRDRRWRDIAEGTPETVATEVMDAEDPVMIMYTSGTTGRPKGTVHTHCGVLVKNALDMGLCIDLGADDRLLWMSDMGWMVGPKIVVSTTLMGATMILADGAPDYPEPDRLWRLAADHGATMLGIAATVVRIMMIHGADKVRAHDLSRLRLTLSVGEPWNAEAWLWFFDHVCARRIPILNYSGGTEIGGAILSGTLHDPLKPSAFGGGVPGHGAAVLDESGNDIAPGEVGELAMRQPSIGLTRGLWRDPERYIETYWSRFPDTWVHGDWASIDEDGLWYIHGRSDDTIKIAGKRIGPAEIEAVLIETGDVIEAAAVGIPDAIKGETVVCVCVPSAADPSAERLSDAVAKELGRPFRPSGVVFVSQLPKTRNQKIMRRLVRAVFTGDEPGDLSSLVNPDALDELRRTVDQEKRS